MKPTRFSRLPARGVALLVVTFLLLILMTLVMLYMNRSLIFEQKSSASLERSTRAFELAEAGLEWGIASLNSPVRINTSCNASTVSADPDFRTRFINPAEQPTRFAVPANSRAGCTVDPDSNALSCSCPAPATPAAALVFGENHQDLDRFMVEFRPVVDPVTNAVVDPLAVEVVAHGCTSADLHCGDSTGSADATAISRSLVTLVSTFGRAPPAAMSAGGVVTVSGNLTVVNTDPASNGITINSGSTVSQGSATRLVTLPGTPAAMSIVASDSTLSELSARDSVGDFFFQSFFSADMEAYRNQPLTKVIRAADCGSASDCGRLVSRWIDEGENRYQQFWVEGDVSFTNANLPASGTLGTADRPVYIATAGSLELKGNVVAYGMFYAANASATENWDYAGSGSATVFGSFVSRGNFSKGSGTLNLIYNPRLFGIGGGRPVGMLVRVPGSWRDY